MKFTSIIVLLFLLSFSVSAGTFIETFDDGNLGRWQELVQLNNASGSWEIVNDELEAVSRDEFLRLLTAGDNTWTDYTIEFDVKPMLGNCEIYPKLLLFRLHIYKGHKSADVWRNIKSNAYYFLETVLAGTTP